MTGYWGLRIGNRKWSQSESGRTFTALAATATVVLRRILLSPLALLWVGLDQLVFLRHFPAHLVFEDFAESDIGGAEVGRVGQQRFAASAAGGVQLAHAPGDEVDQHVGVTHFGQRLPAEITIHDMVWAWVKQSAQRRIWAKSGLVMTLWFSPELCPCSRFVWEP